MEVEHTGVQNFTDVVKLFLVKSNQGRMQLQALVMARTCPAEVLLSKALGPAALWMTLYF